ncbi:IS110 family transposase [Halalkalibacter alkalisediminis]|uniref:IS110 family transposase n=1 Tax=Halalkalibacter alkalisediminis TaxID=935616 RepID=UPI0030811BC8
MLAITGIGKDTIAGFYAEVGDLRYYSHPRQIIKLAGLSLMEHTSGKHKGQTRISIINRHLKHGLVSKSTKIRTLILSGSITDIYLMDRLDEGILEHRLCEIWEG